VQVFGASLRTNGDLQISGLVFTLVVMSNLIRKSTYTLDASTIRKLEYMARLMESHEVGSIETGCKVSCRKRSEERKQCS
jgi:hypothetical protein